MSLMMKVRKSLKNHNLSLSVLTISKSPFSFTGLMVQCLLDDTKKLPRNFAILNVLKNYEDS